VSGKICGKKMKLATDPTYREEQRLAQKKWLQNKPDYWNVGLAGSPLTN
jgi:hypothetical protein